jgi:hypothetical protein
MVEGKCWKCTTDELWRQNRIFEQQLESRSNGSTRFLYQTINDKSYRIRLQSSREVHGGEVKYISGEIRVEIDNGVFEVQAILKIGGITERGPDTSDPSSKNILKWTTDEAQYLKD